MSLAEARLALARLGSAPPVIVHDPLLDTNDVVGSVVDATSNKVGTSGAQTKVHKKKMSKAAIRQRQEQLARFQKDAMLDELTNFDPTKTVDHTRRNLQIMTQSFLTEKQQKSVETIVKAKARQLPHGKPVQKRRKKMRGLANDFDEDEDD